MVINAFKQMPNYCLQTYLDFASSTQFIEIQLKINVEIRICTSLFKIMCLHVKGIVSIVSSNFYQENTDRTDVR